MNRDPDVLKFVSPVDATSSTVTCEQLVPADYLWGPGELRAARRYVRRIIDRLT